MSGTKKMFERTPHRVSRISQPQKAKPFAQFSTDSVQNSQCVRNKNARMRIITAVLRSAPALCRSQKCLAQYVVRFFRNNYRC
jgi:hypothetical protein